MKIKARHLLRLFSIIAAYSVSGCGSVQSNEQIPEKKIIESLQNKNDTLINVNGHNVRIIYPGANSKGTILCLPGWNFNDTNVCNECDLCKKMIERGFIMIFPDMKKSVYATSVYPETRKDWLRFPELNFLTDSLFPFLQKKFDLLRYGQNNFLYGISTGGRGVGMLAMTTDSLFTAGASLSGDFDQTMDVKDNLMIGYYGPYENFKERWELDNPGMHVEKISAALYLGHGSADKVVPVMQSQKFFDALVKNDPHCKSELHIKEKAEHNYEFWGGETEKVMQFFLKFVK